MYSLSKTERLCNKTLFEELIGSNFTFVKYPFRIILKESSEKSEYPARMAVSVSKKRFKRAVKRNYIKRLTRESYRLNKTELYQNLKTDRTIDILFIYLDSQLPEYAKTEKAVKSALKKIGEHFTNTPVHD